MLTKLVVAAREPVQLSQTLQKLAGMRSENNSKMVDDLVVEVRILISSEKLLVNV